jgi:GTP pyrophosphokinase
VLQGEERVRSLELGRRLFDKEARRFGLNPETVLESSELSKFASSTARARSRSCSRTSATASSRRARVLQKSCPAELKEKAPDSAVVSVVKRVLRTGGAADKIKVRGTDDVMVFRAKCCNPIAARRSSATSPVARAFGALGRCTNVLNLMFDPNGASTSSGISRRRWRPTSSG